MTTNRLGLAATLILPAALTLYLSFSAGGFFPRPPALALIVVVQFLIVYITMATNPFGSITPAVAVGIGALALFALWILVSREWSDARARSLLEFDRALLYVVVLVLFALVGGTAARLRWAIRVLVGASVVVVGIGLTARLLPGLWPIVEPLPSPRMQWPLTYANA